MKININTEKIRSQILKYMENPKTHYDTPWGPIKFRKEFVNSILLEIKDVVVEEFDNIDIAYMGEGRGKTLFALQKEWVRWYYLNEMKLITYEWGLHLVYSSLSTLMTDLIKYVKEPFRQFILDEADELKKINWYHPLVKMFFSYLRRGRKFRKFIHLNHPNLKELPEDIVTSRTNNTYEIKMENDLEDLRYIRGHVRMVCIPRASIGYSYYHKKPLDEMYVKNIIAELFKDKNKSFIVMPNSIMHLDVNFNNTFPLDRRAYDDKMEKETAEHFKLARGHSISNVDARTMTSIFMYMAENNLIHKIFKENETARRAYYRLKDNIAKVDSDE